MTTKKNFHISRPHPWHGLSVGPNPPEHVNAYIEITPFDRVKYELDKDTGFLMVDRPLLMSSLPPALYGFVPQTYCDSSVSALMPGASVGDGDPLDICVISERGISRGDILVHATIVGGLPMLDNGEADDKIIAILAGDSIWGGIENLEDLPPSLVKRIHHYFSTYKTQPGDPATILIGEPYGRAHAKKVILAAMEDYNRVFGAP